MPALTICKTGPGGALLADALPTGSLAAGHRLATCSMRASTGSSGGACRTSAGATVGVGLGGTGAEDAGVLPQAARPPNTIDNVDAIATLMATQL
jgi:hypothetical protein